MVGKNIGSAALSLVLLVSVARVDAMQTPDLSTKKGKAVVTVAAVSGVSLALIGGKYVWAWHKKGQLTLEQRAQAKAATLEKPKPFTGEDEASRKEREGLCRYMEEAWTTGLGEIVEKNKTTPVKKNEVVDVAGTLQRVAEEAADLRTQLVENTQGHYKLNRSKSFAEKLNEVAGLTDVERNNARIRVRLMLDEASNGKAIDVTAVRVSRNTLMRSACDGGDKQSRDQMALTHAKEVELKGKAAAGAAGGDASNS